MLTIENKWQNQFSIDIDDIFSMLEKIKERYSESIQYLEEQLEEKQADIDNLQITIDGLKEELTITEEGVENV